MISPKVLAFFALAIVRVQTHNVSSTSLLRVCVEKAGGETIAITNLAVYVLPHLAIVGDTNLHELDATTTSTYLIGGNDNMDCKTGEIRVFDYKKDVLATNSYSIVNINKPFSKVPVAKVGKVINKGVCSVFCNRKIISAYNILAALFQTVCKAEKMIEYELEVGPCFNDRCFKILPTESTMNLIHVFLRGFATVKSPVVCNGTFVGFAEPGNDGITANIVTLI